jgi:ribonucleoside-diphosphate reductase alpha chain
MRAVDFFSSEREVPMAYREPLPNRRNSVVIRFEHKGQTMYGGVSYFDTVEQTRPAEVFLDAGRPGSDLCAMARDAAVCVSLALQHGTPIDSIRAAITREDDGTAAGPLGALLDAIAKNVVHFEPPPSPRKDRELPI